MEPEKRSFAAGALPVGELTPLDVDSGTTKDVLRALARGIEQTHGCLEQHITEQTKFNATQQLSMLTAAEKREEQLTGLAELKGEVRGLVLALGIRKPQDGEEKPRSGALATWGVKKVLGVLGAAGGCIGLFVYVFQLGVKLWPHFVAYMMSLSPT